MVKGNNSSKEYKQRITSAVVKHMQERNTLVTTTTMEIQSTHRIHRVKGTGITAATNGEIEVNVSNAHCDSEDAHTHIRIGKCLNLHSHTESGFKIALSEHVNTRTVSGPMLPDMQCNSLGHIHIYANMRRSRNALTGGSLPSMSLKS